MFQRPTTAMSAPEQSGRPQVTKPRTTTGRPADRPTGRQLTQGRKIMGRGILLLLLGVPLPIVILLALFWR
jgi:hypothetical protein